jgi:hypothetical protein
MGAGLGMVWILRKVGSGGWFLLGFTAFASWNSGAGFCCGGAGKFFCENFSEKFFRNIFGAGKVFGKKFCTDLINYFC